jgi:hypothetical protein
VNLMSKRLRILTVAVIAALLCSLASGAAAAESVVLPPVSQSVISVAVKAEDVEHLYSTQISLSFDEEVLELASAEPAFFAADEFQVVRGNGAEWMNASNTVVGFHQYEVKDGVLHYAATQVGAGVATAGITNVVVLNFNVLKNEETALTLLDAQYIASRDGMLTPLTGASSHIAQWHESPGSGWVPPVSGVDTEVEAFLRTLDSIRNDHSLSEEEQRRMIEDKLIIFIREQARVVIPERRAVVTDATLEAELQLADIDSIMQTLQQTLERLEKQYNQTFDLSELIDELVIVLPSADSSRKSVVTLSAALLDKVRAKGLSLAIGMAEAEFVLHPDTIMEDAKMITLSAERKTAHGQDAVELQVWADDQRIAAFNPQHPIEVRLPYKPQSGTDREKVTVYLINGSEEQPLASSRFNVETGKAVFDASHFSTFAVKPSSVTFGDIARHWGQRIIEVLAGKGIIHGKSIKSFDPDASITRAEFAALVGRTFGLDADTADKPAVPFADVREGDWFYPVIAAVYEAGIVKGTTPTAFEPNKLITREQMAVMIAAAAKAGNIRLHESHPFAAPDAALISPYARESMHALVKTGVMKGDEKKQLKPQDPATRAEAAALLYAIRGLKYESSGGDEHAQ